MICSTEPSLRFLKEIPVKSNISRVAGLFLLFFSYSYAGICSDLKLDKEIVFGFFNGVKTTNDDAKKALRLIQTKFLDSYISAKGEQIEYALFYNKTEGFSDFAETFGQREAEHLKIVKDKYEYFWYLHNHNTDFLNKARRSKKLKKAFEELNQAENEAARALVISSLLSLLDKSGIINDSNTTLLMEENHKEKLDVSPMQTKRHCCLHTLKVIFL